MTTKINILITLLLTITQLSSTAQTDGEAIKTITREELDKLPKRSAKPQYPFTRDTLGIYPNTLIMEGYIVKATQGVSCGVFVGCGSIKVKLTTPIDNYHHEYVFVAMPCFTEKPKDVMNKKIKLELKVLSINYQGMCNSNDAINMNYIDSDVIPFYTPISKNQ